jgi:hypothetical protein
MYHRERKEIPGPDWVASTSYVPHVCDCTMLGKPLGKVSTLRDFLRSYVELMKDETSLISLCEMTDHCVQDREFPIAQRVVNQIL